MRSLAKVKIEMIPRNRIGISAKFTRIIDGLTSEWTKCYQMFYGSINIYKMHFGIFCPLRAIERMNSLHFIVSRISYVVSGVWCMLWSFSVELWQVNMIYYCQFIITLTIYFYSRSCSRTFALFLFAEPHISIDAQLLTQHAINKRKTNI